VGSFPEYIRTSVGGSKIEVTDMNESEQSRYDLLTSPQQTAIDLRLLGMTYKQIGESVFVNTKEHTVRTWFMEGGVCLGAFGWRRETRAKERKEIMAGLDDLLLDMSLEALSTLREAIKKGNVQASVKLLELTKTVQSVDSQTLADEGILLLREIITKRRQDARNGTATYGNGELSVAG